MPTAAESEQSTTGAHTISDIAQDEAYIHNLKRLVEEFMALGLESARNSQSLANRVANNAVSHDEELRKLSVQSLTNSVSTTNMTDKQAIRHADLAIDRQWNVDEQGQMATIGAAVLSDMAKRTFGTTEMAEIVRGVVASELANMAKAGK